MVNPDFDKMSDEERSQYLSSLSLDELLKRSGAGKPNRHADGPAWKSLANDQCHICHRPISDSASLKVKIGGSDCRPRIENELNCSSEIWEKIPDDELEIIWTEFNLYGVYINDISYKVKQVRRKNNAVIFDLQGTDKVLVKIDSKMTIYRFEDAQNL